MPPIYKNTIIQVGDDGKGTAGQIETYATWKVWDCKNRRWSNAPEVELRNCLLTGNHPDVGFAIMEIPTTATDPRLLSPFKDEENNIYFLDGASGNRNHGRFTAATRKVFGRYFANNPKDIWRQIIYGSILHTDCKKLVYKNINYIIVDDENRVDQEQLDDPTNGVNWKTGDCFAKASKDLMQFLGLPIRGVLDPETGEPIDNSGVVDENRAIQFRISLRNEWCAKGTVGYDPRLDYTSPAVFNGEKVDLVIPLSSIKANKPALGNYTGKLLMGLVFEAEERRAKIGWMFLQWFSWETLEKDGIIKRIIKRCEELSKAFNNIQELAAMLRVDAEEAAQEAIANENADGVSYAEYENMMMKIIMNDTRGRLLLHPYVVRRVRERLQSLWLNLAKSAGVKFFSLMTQPDESLSHYHVVLPDGRIKGRKVFCAPDFKPGFYIVFCNPMRHWGDIQIWENRHEGRFVNATGIIAAPAQLFLTVGRDFDGDFFQLIPVERFPNIAKVIASFSDAPATVKFPKVALSGSLPEIAIRSMNDMTGIVASLLARARAANLENFVLLIPAGGEQQQDQEMRLIDFLSQQLQIAVDSIKSAYPNNKNGLDAVKKFLDEQGAYAPWLKDFKDEECYKTRPCAVIEDAQDTISRIVRLVNGYWKEANLGVDDRPRIYQNLLFENVVADEFQLNYAKQHRERYREAIREAIAYKNQNDGDTSRIRQVVQLTKSWVNKILEIKKPDGSLYDPKSWAKAYWYIAHDAMSGDAGLAFTMWPDEIIREIKEGYSEPEDYFNVYACNYGEWAAHKTNPWNGQLVRVRVYLYIGNGKQQRAIELQFPGARDPKLRENFRHLGLISDKYRPYMMLGETRMMQIWSVRFNQRDGKTMLCTLIDPSLSEEDKREILFNPRPKPIVKPKA